MNFRDRALVTPGRTLPRQHDEEREGGREASRTRTRAGQTDKEEEGRGRREEEEGRGGGESRRSRRGEITTLIKYYC